MKLTKEQILKTFKEKVKKITTSGLYKSILKANKTNIEGILKDKLEILIEEFYTRKNREEYYQEILDALMEIPPKNPSVLHWYIKSFLNLDIPRKQFCRKHVSPFKFISDMFFEKVWNSIAFANRTGGKTTNAAVLNHLDMVFKPRCEIISAGSVKDQADRCYRYFLDFHLDNQYLDDLPMTDPTRSRTIYKNRSLLEVITGTIKSFNGPHPQKVRIDEVELMDWDVLQAGMSMSKSVKTREGKVFRAQMCLTSTRKTDTGTMQRLLDDAKKDTRQFGGQKIYQWCIWEIMEKCTRECKNDKVYGDCPIYQNEVFSCKGRAKKCSGYYFIDDVINKVFSMDKDTWEIEWLNMRPSKQVYVYGDYWDRKLHYIDRKELTGDIIVVGGIDFGSSPGHPFVYKEFLCDCTAFKRAVEESEVEGGIIRTKIKFYLSYEYRSGAATMETHADKIKQSPNFSPDIPIFADPSAKQARIDLEELYEVPTIPADNAVQEGIEKVRGHLQEIKGETNYYIFNDYFNCDEFEMIGTDREFEVYKYARFKDGKINNQEPVKMNDHGMDVDRYVISSSIPYIKEMFTPVFEEIEGDGYWS